jgi:hypothetical protein
VSASLHLQRAALPLLLACDISTACGLALAEDDQGVPVGTRIASLALPHPWRSGSHPSLPLAKLRAWTAASASCASGSVSRPTAHRRACQWGAAVSNRHGCWSSASSSGDSAYARGILGSSAAVVEAIWKFRRS